MTLTACSVRFPDRLLIPIIRNTFRIIFRNACAGFARARRIHAQRTDSTFPRRRRILGDGGRAASYEKIRDEKMDERARARGRDGIKTRKCQIRAADFRICNCFPPAKRQRAGKSSRAIKTPPPPAPPPGSRIKHCRKRYCKRRPVFYFSARISARACARSRPDNSAVNLELGGNSGN